MRRFLVGVVTLTLLTACGNGGSTPLPTGTSRPPIGGDVPPLSAEPATINTIGNPIAGCNEAGEDGKGDCYPPLFRTLSQGKAARMVLTNEPGANCPLDEEGVSNDQSHCWPQPTMADGKLTKVMVVCQAEKDGRIWYGVAVKRTQFSNPDDSALAVPLPGDNGNQVIGFNWKEFFVLDNPQAELKPPANTVPATADPFVNT